MRRLWKILLGLLLLFISVVWMFGSMLSTSFRGVANTPIIIPVSIIFFIAGFIFLLSGLFGSSKPVKEKGRRHVIKNGVELVAEDIATKKK